MLRIVAGAAQVHAAQGRPRIELLRRVDELRLRADKAVGTLYYSPVGHKQVRHSGTSSNTNSNTYSTTNTSIAKSNVEAPYLLTGNEDHGLLPLALHQAVVVMVRVEAWRS